MMFGASQSVIDLKKLKIIMQNAPSLNSSARTRSQGWIRKTAIAVVLLVVIAGGVWYQWFRPKAPPTTADGATAAKPGDAPAKAGASSSGPGGGRFGADPNRVQPVAAVAAKLGDINIVQTGLGTVAALKVATVKARVDGLLQSAAFQEGSIVKAGQVLAEIDPQPLKVALSQVEGQLARDQAQLANARLDLERYRTLLAQDSIAKQQLDAQEALVKQFEGTVKIDQAQVDNAKLQLSYTRIAAPISGRLGLRQMDAGNIIRASDTAGLVVITQVDPITVVFTIPQDNLPRVLKQLKAGATLGVDAWDRDQKNKLASGFLLSSDNQIDTATGTIKLKAQFPNPDGLLFPNQFVNVRMVVDTKTGATIIPMAAIQRGARGTVVYVVKDDKTISMRPVTLGPVENDMVAIDGSVAPGELVVVDGIDRLREGAKVEVSAPFVPRQGRGDGKGDGKSDPSKRGSVTGGLVTGGDKAKDAPTTDQKAVSKPATVTPVAPATKTADQPQAPAPTATTSAPPPEPPKSGGGGWRDMTDEQKAELRKKMEGMTDEQKAEFRKKMRERAQQNAQ
jgi:membrane fusion protein, multidrug efflux system